MSIRKTLIQVGDGEPPRLARWEILEHIDKVQGATRMRDRALISLLYLTGCRVSEVCKYQKKENAQVVGKPLMVKQFIIDEEKIVVQGVRCLKRRQMIRRDIPIVLREKDMPFINMLLEYINELEEDDELFPFRRDWAYRILETAGLYPHYMRHLRLTHLASEDNFNDMHLQKFVGWKDTRQASTYAHLNMEDLMERLKK